MDTTVSVIVPAYNAEKTIRRCVDSVLGQSYGQIELIIVDDGSKDQTGTICDEYALTDPRIKVIHQSNHGVSASRNRGIEVAAGTYLTFLDADDELLPGAICALLEKAISADADMVIGGFVYCGADGKDRPDQAGFPVNIRKDSGFLELVLADHPCAYSSWRILYNASFLCDVRFVEGRIVNEDSFFVFQCALKKPTVAFVENPVYRYWYNSNSVTHSSYSIKKYEDTLYFLERKKALIEVNEPAYIENMYNLIVKCHMNLLQNMWNVNGREWRTRKINSIQEFHKYKKYYIPAIEQDKKLYFILTHNLYYVYCFLLTIKNGLNNLKREGK